MKIDIHQIFYKEEQRPHLEACFQPYDNSASKPPDNFEYSVFISNFQKGSITADLTGFVSWKFKQKTGITGQDFKSFIQNNPGYDVYLINPFPDQACFKNVWEQGDYFHPNLSTMTKSLLDKSGYDIDLFSFKNRIDTLCYCNYWVGTKEFWEKYIAFILPLYKYLSHDATTEELNQVNKQADRQIQAPYSPFIFERMFSTYLALNPNLKICAYEYPPEKIQGKYPKLATRLNAMFRASRQKNAYTYQLHRGALFFRMYGYRRLPLLAKIVSKIREWRS